MKFEVFKRTDYMDNPFRVAPPAPCKKASIDYMHTPSRVGTRYTVEIKNLSDLIKFIDGVDQPLVITTAKQHDSDIPVIEILDASLVPISNGVRR